MHFRRYTVWVDAEFRIREFRRADFLRLWEIDRACFPAGISYSQIELLTYMRRPRAFTLVAERREKGEPAIGGEGVQPGEAEDRAIGFIVAEAERRQVGHIITIDVLEEARGSGLGSKLLLAAEARLKELGCRTVLLETAADNVAAMAFYKKHQYFLVKTIPRYYASGVDAFLLKKDLLSAGWDG